MLVWGKSSALSKSKRRDGGNGCLRVKESHLHLWKLIGTDGLTKMKKRPRGPNVSVKCNKYKLSKAKLFRIYYTSFDLGDVLHLMLGYINAVDNFDFSGMDDFAVWGYLLHISHVSALAFWWMLYITYMYAFMHMHHSLDLQMHLVCIHSCICICLAYECIHAYVSCLAMYTFMNMDHGLVYVYIHAYTS